MKLRRTLVNGGPKVHVWNGEHWVDIGDLPAPPGRAGQLGSDMLAALHLAAQEWAHLRGPMMSARPAAEGEVMLPFEPRSYRDFMLYEQHAVQASRGYVKRFMPGTYKVARAIEAVTRRPFPAFPACEAVVRAAHLLHGQSSQLRHGGCHRQLAELHARIGL